MTERRALELASGIVRQHNLLSTATEEERRATIDRFILWWNFVVIPVLDPGCQMPAWMREVQRETVEELEQHCRYKNNG
jgi:hypothetical protein